MLLPVTEGGLVVWAQQELQQKCHEGTSGVSTSPRGPVWEVLGALITLVGYPGGPEVMEDKNSGQIRACLTVRASYRPYPGLGFISGRL